MITLFTFSVLAYIFRISSSFFKVVFVRILHKVLIWMYIYSLNCLMIYSIVDLWFHGFNMIYPTFVVSLKMMTHLVCFFEATLIILFAGRRQHLKKRLKFKRISDRHFFVTIYKYFYHVFSKFPNIWFNWYLDCYRTNFVRFDKTSMFFPIILIDILAFDYVYCVIFSMFVSDFQMNKFDHIFYLITLLNPFW